MDIYNKENNIFLTKYIPSISEQYIPESKNGPHLLRTAHNPNMSLRFVKAVRIVVDLNQKPDERTDVSSVRQVFFGEPGKMHARKSINNSGECTWFIPFDPDEDLSKITCFSPQLTNDHMDKTVYYLLYKGEWSAYDTKSYTGTDTVINYISRVTSDFARSAEAPRGTEYIPGYKKNSDPRQKKDIVSHFPTEKYFRDRFMLCTIPGLLFLLMTGREGFDNDGKVADGSGDEDERMLPVRQRHNLDPDSVELFVSYPTLQLVKYD